MSCAIPLVTAHTCGFHFGAARPMAFDRCGWANTELERKRSRLGALGRDVCVALRPSVPTDTAGGFARVDSILQTGRAPLVYSGNANMRVQCLWSSLKPAGTETMRKSKQPPAKRPRTKTRGMDRAPIDTLPDEVLCHMLLLADARVTVALLFVSRRFYRVCTDESLWRRLFNRDYPACPLNRGCLERMGNALIASATDPEQTPARSLSLFADRLLDRVLDENRPDVHSSRIPNGIAGHWVLNDLLTTGQTCGACVHHWPSVMRARGHRWAYLSNVDRPLSAPIRIRERDRADGRLAVPDRIHAVGRFAYRGGHYRGDLCWVTAQGAWLSQGYATCTGSYIAEPFHPLAGHTVHCTSGNLVLKPDDALHTASWYAFDVSKSQRAGPLDGSAGFMLSTDRTSITAPVFCETSFAQPRQQHEYPLCPATDASYLVIPHEGASDALPSEHEYSGATSKPTDGEQGVLDRPSTMVLLAECLLYKGDPLYAAHRAGSTYAENRNGRLWQCGHYCSRKQSAIYDGIGTSAWTSRLTMDVLCHWSKMPLCVSRTPKGRLAFHGEDTRGQLLEGVFYGLDDEPVLRGTIKGGALLSGRIFCPNGAAIESGSWHHSWNGDMARSLADKCTYIYPNGDRLMLEWPATVEEPKPNITIAAFACAPCSRDNPDQSTSLLQQCQQVNQKDNGDGISKRKTKALKIRPPRGWHKLDLPAWVGDESPTDACETARLPGQNIADRSLKEVPPDSRHVWLLQDTRFATSPGPVVMRHRIDFGNLYFWPQPSAMSEGPYSAKWALDFLDHMVETHGGTVWPRVRAAFAALHVPRSC